MIQLFARRNPHSVNASALRLARGFGSVTVAQRCACQDEAQRTAMPQQTEHEQDVSGIISEGLSGGGQSLDNDTRGFMENRFGHDFSQVKIHTDSRASQSADLVAARAYTVGNDIAFRSAEYNPATSVGRQLLAHELTHVIHQGYARESVQRDDDETTTVQDPSQTSTDASTDTSTQSDSTQGQSQDQSQDASAGQTSQADTAPANPVTDAASADADTTAVDPVPPISGDETTGSVDAYGHAAPGLHGLTHADFGRSFSVAGQTTTAGAGCRGCRPGDCVHVTGTINVTYTASTRVTLPSAAQFRNLTDCEREKVQAAIDNTLAPHEQQHVDAFHQFDGTAALPLDINTCRAGVDAAIRGIINADQRPRESAARAASAALDPFIFSYDMTCDEDASAAETGTPDTAVAQQGEIDTSDSPVLSDAGSPSDNA